MSLTFRGTDIQTANIFLDVAKGFNEPAVVRGEDDTVPQASGQEFGAWIPDHRIILLEGHVQGTGATELLKQQSWRTASNTLRTLMDRTTIGVLVMGPPDHGVSATWRLNARCVNAIPLGPPQNAWTFQRWSFELKCIDSPPEWTTP